jgi:hypothetical protein
MQKHKMMKKCPNKYAQTIELLCGPAVYFVLTNGDFQQREWIFRSSGTG